MTYRGNARDFGAFLDRTVGKVGYLIGTRGQTCTQQMIDARLASTSFSAYWLNIKLYASQWLGWIVADCMGWLEMYWNGGDVGKPIVSFKYPDTNTGAMYALAKSEGLANGPIDTLPFDLPYPIAVGYEGHVGFWYKNMVYQSAGHKMGTIKTFIGDGRYNQTWKYWYKIPYLNYEEDIMLKRGDKGDDVKAWQESLMKMGYPLPNFGADGDFGAETEAATKTFQTTSKLTASGVVDNPTYSAMQRAMIAEMNKDDASITELANKLALSTSLSASLATQLQAEKKKIADYNTAVANLK